jgi:Rod binding domain-containing protein
MTIPAIGSTPTVRQAGAAPSLDPKTETKESRKIREVSREFEAMLVRQMLTSAGVGGKDKEGAYAGMEIDALAKGVTKGRGLGLAQQIADSLTREAHAPVRK